MEESVLIMAQCPNSKGRNVHKQGARDSKMCPLIEVSSFQRCPD